MKSSTVPNSSEQESTSEQDQKAEVFKLAPFNPSSSQIQVKAIELLGLNDEDVLFDLGCGDGRLLIFAAENVKGLKCVGIEIDPVFVARGIQRVQALPQEIRCRVDIREGDVLKLLLDSPNRGSENGEKYKGNSCKSLTLINDATAVYLFILPKGINKIMPLLEALVDKRKQEKRNFRILSYMFKIYEWEPSKVDRTSKGDCPVYLYEFNFANSQPFS